MYEIISKNIKNTKVELIIANGSKIYAPVVQSGIEWSTERKSSAGKLTFKVLNDKKLNISEGNSVSFKYNGNNVFYGFIFSKKREKDNIVSITAYDQLKYFTNKDTYQYKNKTASEILKMIIKDFNLQAGTIDDTKYKIAKKLESNKSLFDIVLNALDETVMNKNKLYCLYDDFGKIMLKDVEDRKIDFVVDAEVAQSYDYDTNIENDVYNQIKLTYDNKETGEREVYITKDSNNINKWGVLQYYDTLQEGENGKSKANALLKLYNEKSRKLKVSNVFGDVRVRAGTSVAVMLSFDDVDLKNYMMCDKVTHNFSDNLHTMTLNLVGGEFTA